MPPNATRLPTVDSGQQAQGSTKRRYRPPAGDPRVRVWGYDWATDSFGGAAVQFKLRFTSRGGKRDVTRGRIGGLSASSKKNLRELVYSLQPAVLSRLVNRRLVRPASFVTLTWPEEDLPRNEEDPEWAKRCLKAWWKQVRRRYPEAWAVWVLEFQQNRNPHFHLIVFWGSPPRSKADWQCLQGWLSESWASVCAAKRVDPDGEVLAKHVRAGTNARPLDERITSAGLTEYLAKAGRDPRGDTADGAVRELTKPLQKEANPLRHQGRWWGTLNRKAVYEATAVHEFEYSPKEALALHRLIQAAWARWAEAVELDLEQLPSWRPAQRLEEELTRAGRRDLLPHGRSAIDDATGELFEAEASDAADRRVA